MGVGRRRRIGWCPPVRWMMMMIVAIIINYEDDEDLVVRDKEVDVSGDYDNYGDGGDIGEQRR